MADAILWILAAMAGFVLWHYLTCKLLALREAIDPFEYRAVTFAQLGEHLHELFRRGGYRSTMIVREETTGKAVRFCKNYEYNSEEIEFTVVADQITRDQAGAREFARGLVRIVNRVSFGASRWPRPSKRYGLVCRCDMNVAGALAAAERIFFSFHCLGGDATFRVRVKGGISWRDGLITGRSGKLRDWARVIAGRCQEGKPYKWWQRPGSRSSLPYAVGGVVVGLYRWARRRREAHLEAQNARNGQADDTGALLSEGNTEQAPGGSQERAKRPAPRQDSQGRRLGAGGKER